MTKNEIVEKLKKSGYHVSNESGIVTFKVSSDEKWPLDEIKNKLASLEYNGSFGFTCISADKIQSYSEPEEIRDTFIPNLEEEEDDSSNFEFDNSNTEFVQTSLFDL